MRIKEIGIFSIIKSSLVQLVMLLALMPSMVKAQNTDLIPKPVHLQQKEGTLSLKTINRIIVPSVEWMDHARLLQAGLAISREIFSADSEKMGKGNSIVIQTSSDLSTVSDSHYTISIAADGIILTGANQQALLLGINRLVQLQLLQDNRDALPLVEISDYPRFGYRGLHLDVSRHFFPIPFLEKMLDMMALYQMNVFHWHLTDGPGWRLEIKSFPKLTGQAAFRTHRVWEDWWDSSRQYLEEGDPLAYGGYYTQEEAKRLVDYAAKRGISIIPEIEMPGHSEEVLAVYPELSCSGEPHSQSEFCLGNEATFDFLEKVLLEVMDIFPSEYIHIGGDEANKSAWKKCPKCQGRIAEENLRDEDELQSYGIRRMEKFLSSHGRKLLGWDEIIEGGLAPGATVMSWRGESGGIKAAEAGHEVVMTPGGYCYFDSYQTDPATQPKAIGGYLPIEKVYSYDPVPAELANEKAHLIKGVQANVWTEYIPSQEHVEYMIFPRLLALSEVAWTSPENKGWEDFFSRLQSHYRLLQRKGINYYRPIAELKIKAQVDTVKEASLVSISSERYGAEIRYTLDGSDPSHDSKKYEGPFYEKGTSEVRAAMVLGNGEMGPVAKMELAYHLAVGAKVTYHVPYSENKYPAKGAATLVNGQTGSFTYGDGEWQGFEGKDMDVTVELKEAQKVGFIKARFMQLTGPGVYLPEEIRCSWSVDGKQFSQPVTVSHTVPESEDRLVIYPFEIPVGEEVKHVRIVAKINKGFLFTDELIFY
ncbi:family 20 glycosylhydrolase [Echinicola sediminis]